MNRGTKSREMEVASTFPMTVLQDLFHLINRKYDDRLLLLKALS